MIVQGLLNLVKAVLTPIFALLPTLDLSPVTQAVSSGASDLGGLVAPFNGIFPLIELLDLCVWFATYVVPAVLTYLVANWVYRHIPSVGGFGAGAG